MSDIFIRYATKGWEPAKQLVELLGQQGWSLWWDRAILPGRTFDEVIKQALAAVRYVVVLWSKVAEESRWVRTEASDGLDRGTLVSALIEQARIPLEFSVCKRRTCSTGEAKSRIRNWRNCYGQSKRWFAAF